MILSLWTRNNETAEVIETAPMDERGCRAWNVTRARYALDEVYGSVEEIEAALVAEGWAKEAWGEPPR